jgi:hypothetical protein
MLVVKIKQDTGYVATEETNAKSGYQEWKYVPIYVLKLTELKGDQNVMGSNVETIKATSYEGDLKVPFDDSKGDVKAKVYSPVGKTGFSIEGSCTRQ